MASCGEAAANWGRAQQKSLALSPGPLREIPPRNSREKSPLKLPEIGLDKKRDL
jgi:hypothetical protein